MNLKSIFKNYSNCKICNRKCFIETYIEKVSSKRITYSTKYVPEDNSIICIENGPYDIELSNMVIHIEDESFKIEHHKDIKSHNINELSVLIKFYCLNENNKYIVEAQDFDECYSIRPDFFNKSDSLEHYFYMHKITIFPPNNTLTNMQVSEYFENKNYILKKDFIKNTTIIEKKFKKIKINSIFERDFSSIDFDKLLENTNLLK